MKDKKNTENISIALWYVREGQIYESLLDMTSVAHDELDEATLAMKTITVLRNAGLDCDKMLSQLTLASTLPAILKDFYHLREAFSIMYKLIATLTTFPYLTAMCESSFSTPAMIDQPQQISTLQKHQAKLI